MNSSEAAESYIEQLTGGCDQLEAYAAYARRTERSVLSLLGALLSKAALAVSHQVCIPPKTWGRTDPAVSRSLVPGAIHLGSYVMLCRRSWCGEIRRHSCC